MKCKVCGKEFELKVDNHYIVRDEEVERTGIVGIVGNNTEKESKLYDAFDCPICGCQNVMQERKRSFTIAASVGHVDEAVFVEKEAEKEIEEDEGVCDGNCKGCWGEYVCGKSSENKKEVEVKEKQQEEAKPEEECDHVCETCRETECKEEKKRDCFGEFNADAVKCIACNLNMECKHHSCFGTYNYEDCEDIDCGCMPECKKAKEEEMERVKNRIEENKKNKESEEKKC